MCVLQHEHALNTYFSSLYQLVIDTKITLKLSCVNLQHFFLTIFSKYSIYYTIFLFLKLS